MNIKKGKTRIEYRVKELAQKLAISEKIEQDKKNAEKEKTENE